jgi:hypothetical protein
VQQWRGAGDDDAGGWLYQRHIMKKIEFLFVIIVAYSALIIVPVSAEYQTGSLPVMGNASAPADYLITIDPIGNYTIGGVFFINGTTNLPVSNNLTLEIMDSRIYSPPHMKNWIFVRIPGRFVSIQFVPIVSDSRGDGQWSVNVTDAVNGLDPSTYLVAIWSETNASCDNSFCPEERPPLAVATAYLVISPADSSEISAYVVSDTLFGPSRNETRTVPVTTNPGKTPSSPLIDALPSAIITMILLSKIFHHKCR